MTKCYFCPYIYFFDFLGFPFFGRGGGGVVGGGSGCRESDLNKQKHRGQKSVQHFFIIKTSNPELNKYAFRLR